MSNLNKLTGIGKELLIADTGEVLSAFKNGNFIGKVIAENEEVTLVTAACDCDDCAEREKPCHSDCDAEEACQGCKELYEYNKEVCFEIDYAQGRF